MKIKRKIISIGFSRLITLPKYWTEQQAIQDDDKIEMIITQEGDLILKGKKND